MSEGLAVVPRHYLWRFPGSPITVHLDLEAVARLQEQLRQTPRDGTTHGLLFGGHSGATTEILDFQPVSGQLSPEAAQKDREHRLVGYYRTEAGETLRPNKSDLSLLGTLFANPYEVFLLIQSNGFGPANATFFFHDRDSRIPEVPLLEFPFDSALLSTEERQRIQRSRRPAMENSVVHSEARRNPIPAAPRRRFGRVAWLLLALVFLGAAVGSVAWLRTGPPVSARSGAGSVSSVSLRARRQNGDLELTWDRTSAVVRAATSGTLFVEDGDVRLEIPLDAAQVRGGSVLYVPSTDRIQLQLTVTTPERGATESVMVVLPKVGAPRRQPLEPAGDAEGPGGATRAENSPIQADSPNGSAPGSVPRVSQGLPAPPVADAGSRSTARQSAAADPVVQTDANPGAMLRPAVAITRVQAEAPAEFRSTAFDPVTIEVRVAIDREGKVVRAEPVAVGSANRAFVEEAVRSARLWRFQPAQRGEEPVESETVLQFVFKP